MALRGNGAGKARLGDADARDVRGSVARAWYVAEVRQMRRMMRFSFFPPFPLGPGEIYKSRIKDMRVI